MRALSDLGRAAASRPPPKLPSVLVRELMREKDALMREKDARLADVVREKDARLADVVREKDARILEKDKRIAEAASRLAEVRKTGDLEVSRAKHDADVARGVVDARGLASPTSTTSSSARAAGARANPA